jgi:glucose/arabinose dehydrogenase
MKQMKRNILGLGLGIALVAGVSHIAVAQTQQQAPTQQQQGQPHQGQIQIQPEVNVEDIMPQAEAQVNSIDQEVGLNLTEEQVAGLSEAMALFMVGQHEATSDEQLQSMASEYEDQVNSVLTDEQKETIANHSEANQ